MITIPQIKAARGLLGWSQKDLAAASSVSLRAVAKIELEQVTPRKETLLAIKCAFEKEGVVFLGFHGLEKRDEKLELKTFTGKEGLQKIQTDILRTLPRGGEVLLANVDNDKHWSRDSESIKLIKRWVEEREKLGIITRCLVCEGEKFFLQNRELYRIVPQELFSQVPYYIYGDKTVFMLLAQLPIRSILIENALLTEAFRNQFEYSWKIGKKPSSSS